MKKSMFARLAVPCLGAILAGCSAGTVAPELVLESDHVRQAAAGARVDLERRLICWKGGTPEFDGRISANEYEDGAHFTWSREWIEAMQAEIGSPEDLSFSGWIKHDGERLYIALEVTDDILYGIETDRWLPSRAPDAHVIGERERGWPWFGDMVEILLYGRMLDLGTPIADVTGDGRGIQIIFNLTKSLEGGVGVPGMLPHGPGRTVENWENNRRWILDDIIETRTSIDQPNNSYVIEVGIRLNGGIEIGDGRYWAMGDPDTPIGFNLAVGDVDRFENSPDGLLHHETWWAGKTIRDEAGARSKLWGVLVMTSEQMPPVRD